MAHYVLFVLGECCWVWDGAFATLEVERLHVAISSSITAHYTFRIVESLLNILPIIVHCGIDR